MQSKTARVINSGPWKQHQGKKRHTHTTRTNTRTETAILGLHAPGQELIRKNSARISKLIRRLIRSTENNFSVA